MTDANLEWMLNAKRNGVAPLHVNTASPAVEVEMWSLYRTQLLAELADVEHVTTARRLVADCLSV